MCMFIKIKKSNQPSTTCKNLERCEEKQLNDLDNEKKTMINRDIDNIYDQIYFELLTDLAFLRNEKNDLFKTVIESVKDKINDIDQAIQELNDKVRKLSLEQHSTWEIKLIDLQSKREDLIQNIRTEFEYQKYQLQSWIDEELKKSNDFKSEIIPSAIPFSE